MAANPPVVTSFISKKVVFPESVPASSANASQATTSNATAALTLAGTTGQTGAGTTPGAVVLAAVFWSYAAAPTGGRLTILDGANSVLDLDITGAGYNSVHFSPPLCGSPNQNLVITLYPGGSGVTGKVAAQAWTLF